MGEAADLSASSLTALADSLTHDCAQLMTALERGESVDPSELLRLGDRLRHWLRETRSVVHSAEPFFGDREAGASLADACADVMANADVVEAAIAVSDRVAQSMVRRRAAEAISAPMTYDGKFARFAALCSTRRAFHRVVEPMIADMHAECTAAIADGDVRKARRVMWLWRRDILFAIAWPVPVSRVLKGMGAAYALYRQIHGG